MVRKERLELSRVAPLEPKSSASTNSATFAISGDRLLKRRIIPTVACCGNPGETFIPASRLITQQVSYQPQTPRITQLNTGPGYETNQRQKQRYGRKNLLRTSPKSRKQSTESKPLHANNLGIAPSADTNP